SSGALRSGRREPEFTSQRAVAAWTFIPSLVQAGEARQQPVHIVRRELAVREQDAVADRSDQDVDRIIDREPGLAARQSAVVQGFQVMGRVSATARGGDF